MRLRFRSSPRPRRPVLFTALGSVALLVATPASAQDGPTATGGGNDEPTQTAPEDEPTETEAENEPTETGAENEPTETEAENEPTETEAENEPTETASDDEPTTTEEPDDDIDPGITGGPTLTGGFGIPTYPAASVPPTENAPFRQHSRAPDGTVFIAVGAFLGAVGLGVLLWRAIVGLLLHRSVKRAAMAQLGSDTKSDFPAPPAPFYKYTDQGSTMSLNGGAANGRGVRRTNRGPIPSSTPSQSNLFFSPTAANTGSTGNRGSTLLPSGFYAASGNASLDQPISLTNLRPDSLGQGVGRNVGPSPPDSPSFPPVRRGSPALSARRDLSTSSLNLSAPIPSGQRAPSAYLDDLLADDPGSLPPPHMPPSAGPKNLGPGSNRI